jgi:hypothetical protein
VPYGFFVGSPEGPASHAAEIGEPNDRAAIRDINADSSIPTLQARI